MKRQQIAFVNHALIGRKNVFSMRIRGEKMKIRIELKNQWSWHTKGWLIDEEIDLKKEPIVLKYGSLILTLTKVKK